VEAPRQKIVPVLLLAAVKSLVDREPASPLGRIYAGGPGDPWPAFRALLEQRFDEVAQLLRTRRTQTNEVGRASATLLALALAEHRVERPGNTPQAQPQPGRNATSRQDRRGQSMPPAFTTSASPRFEARQERRTEARGDPRQQPRYEPRAQPRFEPRAQPRFEPRTQPRFEAQQRQAPRMENRGGGGGGWREQAGRGQGRG